MGVDSEGANAMLRTMAAAVFFLIDVRCGGWVCGGWLERVARHRILKDKEYSTVQ